MRGRRLVLLLVIYVGLDFANPMMPGAVNFDPGDSVEAIHAERGRLPESPVATAPDPAAGPVEPPPMADTVGMRPIVAVPRATPILAGPPPHAAPPEPSAVPDPH